MSENMWQKQLCRHQCQWRRRRRCFRYQSWDSTAAPDKDHGDPQWGRCQPDWEFHIEIDAWPTEAVMLWETFLGFWQNLWPTGKRSPHWSKFAGRTCDLIGNLWSSVFLKDCTPWRVPCWSRTVSCEGPSCSGEICEVFLSCPAEAAVTELCVVMCCEPHSPASLRGRRWRSEINEVKTRKQRGLEGRCFKNGFIYFYHNLIWFGINSVKLLMSVLSMMVAGEWSLLVLSLTHKPLVFFSLPSPMRRGVIEPLWLAPDVQPGSTYPKCLCSGVFVVMLVF